VSKRSSKGETEIYDHFINELTSKDGIAIQLEASKHLASVAKIIGADRAKTHLLPLITRYIWPTEDGLDQGKPEVIASLASQMNAQFYHHLGCASGTTPFVKYFLPILERLCGYDETLVRQSIITSFIAIIDDIEIESIFSAIIPCYHRLSNDDNFHSRVSACLLTPAIYAKLDTVWKEDQIRIGSKPNTLSITMFKREILNMHQALLQDNWSLVRFNASKSLADIIPLCRDAHFFQWTLPSIFSSLSSQVPTRHRLLLLDLIISTLKQLPNVKYLQQPENGTPMPARNATSAIEERCIEELESLANDKSWKIRKGLAEKLPGVCEALTADRRKRHASAVVRWINVLLSDHELSVREIFIDNLAKCLEFIPVADLEEDLVNNILALSTDPSEKVRYKVSECFLEVFRLGTLPNQPLLLLLERLTSKENDFCLINVLSQLPELVRLGPNFRKFVKNHIEIWHLDKRWRVRHVICQSISSIAQHYGAREFENSVFKTILLKYYVDSAYEVRLECCNQLRQLTNHLKIPYVSRELLPLLLDGTRTYQLRHVRFQAARKLSDVFDTNTWLQMFEEPLLKGLKDPIPNIRLAACEAVTECHKKIQRSQKVEAFRSSLQHLLKDHDPDVVYHSQQAFIYFDPD